MTVAQERLGKEGRERAGRSFVGLEPEYKRLQRGSVRLAGWEGVVVWTHDWHMNSQWFQAEAVELGCRALPSPSYWPTWFWAREKKTQATRGVVEQWVNWR